MAVVAAQQLDVREEHVHPVERVREASANPEIVVAKQPIVLELALRGIHLPRRLEWVARARAEAQPPMDALPGQHPSPCEPPGELEFSLERRVATADRDVVQDLLDKRVGVATLDRESR